MPIVNTTFEGLDKPNPDGSFDVIVRNFDNEGKEYKYSQNVKPNFDIVADNAIKVANLNEQLAAQEFEALIGQP